MEIKAVGVTVVVVIAVIAGALGGWVVEATATSGANDPAVVIAEWGSRIAQVSCNFLNSDGTVTTLAGSGMLVRSASGTLDVVASADVLSQEGRVADACNIDLAGAPSYTAMSGAIHIDLEPVIDAGFLQLSGVRTSEAALVQNTPLCTGEPVIGEPIVVLGYPSAGRQAFVATDGIVAGSDDGNYDFVTAPSDEGDDGGAVIDVLHDCYLGMVSSGDSSQSEYLGTVLKWSSFKAELQGTI